MSGKILQIVAKLQRSSDVPPCIVDRNPAIIRDAIVSMGHVQSNVLRRKVSRYKENIVKGIVILQEIQNVFQPSRSSFRVPTDIVRAVVIALRGDFQKAA